jgi:hypothetical protein
LCPSPAAPHPVGGRLAEAGTDGILLDVLARVLESLVVVDHERDEPLAEEVPVPEVPVVEAARVSAVQQPHPVGEVLTGRLDDEVIVRPHQAVRMQAPAVPARRLEEKVDEVLPVDVVQVEQLPEDSACHHVVDAIGEEVARRAVHHDDRADAAAASPGLDASWHALGTKALSRVAGGRARVPWADLSRAVVSGRLSP